MRQNVLTYSYGKCAPFAKKAGIQNNAKKLLKSIFPDVWK